MNLVDRVLEFIGKRRRAYCSVFLNPNGEEVLKDLAKFCRANETTFHTDPRLHSALEGRREVWLRIQRHLQLTDEQLMALHAPAQAASPRRSTDD
jgi:hypothetical protein